MARAMSSPEGWNLCWAWSDLRRGLALRRLSADGGVRTAVARGLQVQSVSRLKAEVAAKPWLDGVELRGRLDATVTLLCGVTLELFEHRVDETFCVRIVPPGSENAWKWPGGEDVPMDLEADDPPDVLVGDRVNVGALLVEQLALAVPPFPRKADAVFASVADGEPSSPFSALARLTERSKGT